MNVIYYFLEELSMSDFNYQEKIVLELAIARLKDEIKMLYQERDSAQKNLNSHKTGLILCAVLWPTCVIINWIMNALTSGIPPYASLIVTFLTIILFLSILVFPVAFVVFLVLFLKDRGNTKKEINRINIAIVMKEEELKRTLNLVNG